MENKALVAKSKPRIKTPTTWSGFLDGNLRKKLILEDPRTSTPGLGFILFMHSIFEKSGKMTGSSLWKKIQSNTLTVTPGWSQAYSLFLSGEAPYVWSYTTSEAYHAKENQNDFKAVQMKEGHPIQIEGAVILKSTKLAIPFLELLISKEIQEKVPETQWMYPVVDVELPASYKNVKEPGTAKINPVNMMEIDEIQRSWKSTVSEF